MYKFFKRTFDIVSSGIALIILFPFFLVAAFLIKISSRGPVFYKQKRVGIGGGEFFIYKFRTMRTDLAGPPVTQKDDSRITAVGKLLRLTKLDELPQLINVFKGEMSIVGPRPEIPELVKSYSEEQRELLNVKPGITSPATIYYRDEEEIVGTKEEILEYHRSVLIPKKTAFDLEYLDKASFLYDIKLIFLTFLSILTNQSGYVREKAYKNRRLFIIISIIFISIASYYLSFKMRLGNINMFYLDKFYRTVPVALFLRLLFFGIFDLYEGYWRYVSISEIINIIKANLLVMLSFIAFEIFFLDESYPTGAVFIDFLLATFLFSGQRFFLRLMREIYEPITPRARIKAIIIGANDRGELLLREIKRDTELAYHIVGFVDKNEQKVNSKIHNIPVLGTVKDIPAIIEKYGIQCIINTLEKMEPEDTRLLARMKFEFDIKIRNIPYIADFLNGRLNKKIIRDVKFEDLLGREAVSLDTESISKSFKSKRVLVTGAGGSIGSELVRQLMRFGPEEVFLLDKDETLLYELEMELQEIEKKKNIKVLIGDIRNKERLDFFFKRFRPEIVLHAAAFKHVPLMEIHPHEAVINNIYGTKNLVETAAKNNVRKFVLISTDKAVSPTSVMGATKRTAEKILLNSSIAEKTGMQCMAVRFGNVLGSRGSVIPLFKKQIEKGGPVRITHEDITRFFMSIPEASQLVLQAASMGKGNEIFILKMGSPIKIRDLAYNLIEFSGLKPEIDIKVEYIGLRPGEKLYEELLTDLEGTSATAHEKILVINNPAENFNKQFELLHNYSQNIYTFANAQVRYLLKKLVPEYEPRKHIEEIPGL